MLLGTGNSTSGAMLWEKNFELTLYAWTMSSISHSVPEPLRSTSSGGMGMIVLSEKMNGWIYVMYLARHRRNPLH